MGVVGIAEGGVARVDLQSAHHLVELDIGAAAHNLQRHLVGAPEAAHRLHVDVVADLVGIEARRVGHKVEMVGMVADEKGIGEDGVGLLETAGGQDERVGAFGGIEHEAHVKRLGRLERHIGAVGVGADEDAGTLPPHRLVHVVELLRRVARRGHENAAGPREAVEDGVVELVVALEVLEAALAERDDAGATHALGIVEDVFEAERIDGIGVFLVIGRVDELLIVDRAVGHQTEVAAEGHAAVGTVVATACGDAGGMGAVGLAESVVAVAERQQLFLGGVFASDIERAANGVGRYLVPQPLDAVAREVGVVEGGVSEVEADVHHAHHNAIAGIGLWECRSRIDGQCIEMAGGGVHQRMGAATGLDAAYAMVQRERRQTAHGDVGDVDFTKTSQTAAAVCLEHVVAVGREADEGAHMLLALAARTLQPGFRVEGLLTVDEHHAQPWR